jgi:hypothetical protein
MECYESTFEGKIFCRLVAIDPVCGNAEVGSAVAVGPYISRERYFANRMLIFR